MLRLGAHNSIAGGLHNAVAEAKSIGADALQMFCKNQRQWRAKPLAPEDVAAWKSALAASGLGPVMVHDSYLINMGNPDPAKRESSRLAFLDELVRCDQLGVQYLNFHPGSHMAEAKADRDGATVRKACLERIAQSMQQCIDETKGSNVKLVLENAAGQGTNVGNSWEELATIISHVGSKDRVGVTIDTQHSWACGYDWVSRYDDVWDEFDAKVGRKWLVAFHLNDSKMPCGSRVDRHDTIGEGKLGLPFFRRLVNDRRLDGLLGILETPEGPESWKKEIAMLRSLREGGPSAKAALPATKPV
jgi:deoxyribonuclease IV